MVKQIDWIEKKDDANYSIAEKDKATITSRTA